MQESGTDADVLARRSALVLALLCGPGYAAGLPVPCFKRRDPAEFLLAGGSNPHKRRRLQDGVGGTYGRSALEAAIAASLAAVGGSAAAAAVAPAPAAPSSATPETLAAALVAGGQGCMDAVASAAPRFASLKVWWASQLALVVPTLLSAPLLHFPVAQQGLSSANIMTYAATVLPVLLRADVAAVVLALGRYEVLQVCPCLCVASAED